jgi:membrane-associated phospholipid phosphatase
LREFDRRGEKAVPEDISKKGKSAKTHAGVDQNGGCSGGLNPPSGQFAYCLEELADQGQVEPTATAWLNGHQITVPTREQVLQFSEGDKAHGRWRIAPADFPTEEQLKSQLQIIRDLAPDRDNYPPYRTDRPYRRGSETLTITPLSRFLQLQPPPFGTIFDVTNHPTVGVQEGEVNQQHLGILGRHDLVDQGQELARAFESETPGLFHRHALNWLLYSRPDISPIRQARVWFALDITIYTALSTAWYYKWSHPDYSRLLRPSEYARTCEKDELRVLFDTTVNDDGREIGTKEKEGDRPGTPRHPAWPSGHSTYSAAASHILEYFFSPETLFEEDETVFQQADEIEREMKAAALAQPVWMAAQLRRLANNIGEARIWAGVHWISDHSAGQKIGRAAAQAVMEQFLDDCIVKAGDRISTALPRPDLDERAREARNCTGERNPQERPHDFIPPKEDRKALREKFVF